MTGGTISGSSYSSQLEKTVTYSGSIGSNFHVGMTATAGNQGTFSFSGTLTGDHQMSDGYTHTNGSYSQSGSFSAG